MAATASITLGPHSDLKTAANGRAEAYDIHADVGDILFTKQQLAEKTEQLGKVLGQEYIDKRPLLMPILKGGFICECWDSSRAGHAALRSPRREKGADLRVGCCCLHAATFAVAADLVRALDPCPQDAEVEFVSARWVCIRSSAEGQAGRVLQSKGC